MSLYIGKIGSNQNHVHITNSSVSLSTLKSTDVTSSTVLHSGFPFLEVVHIQLVTGEQGSDYVLSYDQGSTDAYNDGCNPIILVHKVDSDNWSVATGGSPVVSSTDITIYYSTTSADCDSIRVLWYRNIITTPSAGISVDNERFTANGVSLVGHSMLCLTGSTSDVPNNIDPNYVTIDNDVTTYFTATNSADSFIDSYKLSLTGSSINQQRKDSNNIYHSIFNASTKPAFMIGTQYTSYCTDISQNRLEVPLVIPTDWDYLLVECVHIKLFDGLTDLGFQNVIYIVAQTDFQYRVYHYQTQGGSYSGYYFVDSSTNKLIIENVQVGDNASSTSVTIKRLANF